jgi:hypothetical protein
MSSVSEQPLFPFFNNTTFWEQAIKTQLFRNKPSKQNFFGQVFKAQLSISSLPFLQQHNLTGFGNASNRKEFAITIVHIASPADF